MPSPTHTIEALLTDLAAFVRDRDRKLLHVLVDVELRRGVVALACAQENRADNHSPFVVFEQPHTPASRGWTLRAAAARAQHERRRDGAAPPIAELPPRPPVGDEVSRFAQQLQQLVHATPEGADGLVVVVAPSTLADAAAWAASLEMLIERPRLAAVRWIVIEVETDITGKLAATLGERALRSDARRSSDAKLDGLADLASGRGPAAPRGVQPPPRRDVPDRNPDPEGEQRQLVGRLSLAAAVASTRGRGAEAVEHQRRARDLCQASGWTAEAITMELALGGHLVAAGATREGELAFTRAVDAATQAGMHDKAATAGFGVAAARTVRGERHTAVVAYAEAAMAAERGDSMVLAIEANRLAGQAALDMQMEPQAITFLAKAVQLGDAHPIEAQHSSAAEAARSLAALCRKRGLGARADELEDAAERLGASANRELSSPAPPPIAALAVAPAAAEPTTDDGEGTALLTLEQIAMLQARAASSNPTRAAEASRSWTPDEIRSLQRALDHSLTDETSRILSPDELAALRGEAVVPDEELPVPPPWLTSAPASGASKEGG